MNREPCGHCKACINFNGKDGSGYQPCHLPVQDYHSDEQMKRLVSLFIDIPPPPKPPPSREMGSSSIVTGIVFMGIVGFILGFCFAHIIGAV